MSTIEFAHVSVDYDGTRVLADVSLSVERGRWVCLIGPNGAGKTTMLKAIAGLVPHEEGDIRLEGAPVRKMSRRRTAQLVAYLPQRPAIPAGMGVTDYILAGRTPHISYLGSEGRRDLDVVAEVLERLQLESFAERTLGSLSGGELQRVILGRALAQQAPVLLLDEPTSALDVGHQQQVLELIDKLRLERTLTVVSAMHDLILAGQFADRLLMLDGGRAVAAGAARAVLTEDLIRRHYGARVRVLHENGGEVVVVPTRVRGDR